MSAAEGTASGMARALEVRDLLREDTAVVSASQRRLLADLVEAMAMGTSVMEQMARVLPGWPDEQRTVQALSWERSAEAYQRLLAQWPAEPQWPAS